MRAATIDMGVIADSMDTKSIADMMDIFGKEAEDLNVAVGDEDFFNPTEKR